ncbi:hypothetical protein AAG906_004579 [Vitis piasezkii]
MSIRKDEPHKIIDTNTLDEILLYESWEKSNHLSVMYIKTKISVGIQWLLTKQFVTSDKALANTLIMKFTSLKLTDIRGVREHIMGMRNIVAQLKKLEIYNPHFKFLVGYTKPKEASENTRIVESRNVKFLEYDLVSGGNQFRNIVSDIDHIESQLSTSSDRLFVVHNTPQVQTGVEQTIAEVQPVFEVPQAVDNISIDQVDQELPDTSEQQVEPHVFLEDNGATLRRSTRTKRLAIPSDYLVYLQESYYSIGAENDPELVSQAMSCKESKLWYNAMKDEMSSMRCNDV